MGGKHRYEPEVHRATWKPAEEGAEPSRIEHLNTALTDIPVPKAKPWWARLRKGKSAG